MLSIPHGVIAAPLVRERIGSDVDPLPGVHPRVAEPDLQPLTAQGLPRKLPAQLAEFLHLEKSSISRLVRKLIDGGELKETADADDARVKPLSLTPKGRRTLAALHDFGRRKVSGALTRLTDAERRTVREGLMLYARALRVDHAEQTEAAVA